MNHRRSFRSWTLLLNLRERKCENETEMTPGHVTENGSEVNRSATPVYVTTEPQCHLRYGCSRRRLELFAIQINFDVLLYTMFLMHFKTCPPLDRHHIALRSVYFRGLFTERKWCRVRSFLRSLLSYVTFVRRCKWKQRISFLHILNFFLIGSIFDVYGLQSYLIRIQNYITLPTLVTWLAL